MKILILSKLLPSVRGISGSLIIYNRVRYLAEQGHELGLLSFVERTDPAQVDALRPLFREIELVPAPIIENPLKRFFWQWLCAVPYPFCEMRSWTMARQVGVMVGRSSYNVVLAEFSAMGQFLYRNPYLPAVRRVLSCHECCSTAYAKSIQAGGWTWSNMVKRLTFNQVRQYEVGMYRNMDHVLVLTPQERYGLLQYAPNLRISVVPPEVDTEYYTPTPPAAREDSIGFIGYFSNESNRDAVHWFVRTVWPSLLRAHPQLRFYVIGRGTTPDIRNLGRRDARIIVTGEVADIRPHLAKLRVFICPVRMGSGFRVKILEAMAAGVPVVSTALGAEGLPPWSGETLLLANTPNQLSRCIRLLLADAGLRQKLADNARELVVTRFSRRYGMPILEKVLHEVVAGYD